MTTPVPICCAGWHETHHVAILVDHRDVAGVAAMARVTVEGNLYRPADGGGIGLKAQVILAVIQATLSENR